METQVLSDLYKLITILVMIGIVIVITLMVLGNVRLLSGEFPSEELNVTLEVRKAVCNTGDPTGNGGSHNVDFELFFSAKDGQRRTITFTPTITLSGTTWWPWSTSLPKIDLKDGSGEFLYKTTMPATASGTTFATITLWTFTEASESDCMVRAFSPGVQQIYGGQLDFGSEANSLTDLLTECKTRFEKSITLPQLVACP